ncbi:MAG: NAD(+) diphosphatase [Oscillospiraceae bacterium]|nr:NAD(+) diphosphatase [Oscillospiraceae bacterium]
MIQDIAPKKLDNHFQCLAPAANDRMISFCDGKLFCRPEKDTLAFPTVAEAGCEAETYLFSIDDTRYFLARQDAAPACEGFAYHGLGVLRQVGDMDQRLAGATAWHLAEWYRTHRYCGACGERTALGTDERRIDCPSCGAQYYPHISPCIIVAVSDGDKLLLTRYRGRSYRRDALIAGFTEIGESSEQTVHREVMEEAGIRVKNLRFYKSQPWGFSGSLLMGYFAELDGDGTITMERDELEQAQWVPRDEIVFEDVEKISLTAEMILLFKNGQTR